MTGYTTREIARLLDLSPRRVRSFVRSGLLSPQKTAGRAFRFSFEDLVFLKAARDLLTSRVGPRRIRRALSRLRRELPQGRPLAGLRLSSEGGRLVVTDGQRRWQPDSGQILFDFDVGKLARKVAPLARRAFARAKEQALERDLSADDWFAWGCELEAAAPEQAREAYERAIALEEEHADARVNLGRLLHERGDAAGAQEQYRKALASRPEDSTAAFNLGVALEDLGRDREALDAYERAARLDPEHADAHFNAANICERSGDAAAAVGHLKAYRKLLRAGQ